MSRIRALNDWMKKYAADNGDVYLDYFSSMVDENGVMKAEFTQDDLHPNAAGYAVMASRAEDAIKQALR
jgi:lysophospholipase L1-like esterase